MNTNKDKDENQSNDWPYSYSEESEKESIIYGGSSDCDHDWEYLQIWNGDNLIPEYQCKKCSASKAA